MQATVIEAIVQRFATAFRRDFPDLVGRPLLVALSGGSDSTAMLHLVHRSGVAGPIAAMHVHHHQRGDEADRDAQFCLDLGARLGVAVAVGHLEREVPRGESPEAHWRHERYRLLEDERTRLGAAAVITGHTLDDQAETVLLQALRGGGPAALAGVRRRWPALARPLLLFRRAELRAWLELEGLRWCEDSTNAAGDRPRSWLRGTVLPLLEAGFPRSSEHLAALAATLAAEDDYLDRQVSGLAELPLLRRPVPLARVAALPDALRPRWLLALAARLPLAESPSRRQLELFGELVAGRSPAALDLGRRWVLRREGARLRLAPPPLTPFAAVPAALSVGLPGGFLARLGAATEEPSYRAVLAPGVLAAAPVWRALRAGERGPGGLRLGPALARAGVPPEWRRAWPVLEAGATIVWVPALAPTPGWGAEGPHGVAAELEEPWKHLARSSPLR